MAKSKKKPATKKKAAKKAKPRKKRAEGVDKGGRPTKYDPTVHPRLAEALAETEHIVEEMAPLMQISEATFYNWQNEHPEFLEAVRSGKDPVDMKVQNELYKNCFEREVIEEKVIVEDGKPKKMELTKKQVMGNVNAQKTWLHNRQPDRWGNRQQIDINREDPLGKLTDEQLDAEDRRLDAIMDQKTEKQCEEGKGEETCA